MRELGRGAGRNRSAAVNAALARARAGRGLPLRAKTVVVVGAGVAGFRAAERLRELGFDGRLIIIGDEAHRPYNRTPLSKQVLAGTGRLSDLRLDAYTRLDAVWRLGTAVVGLDPDRSVVQLPGGEEIAYDGLVIATGVQARHLPGAPTSSRYVWSIRTLADGRAVSRLVSSGARHVVVIGTGFIGCEVAASLRARGLDVSLVGRADHLLGNAVGSQVGRVVTQVHRRAGVHLHLGRQPVGWAASDVRDDPYGPVHSRRRRGVGVRLDDGTILRADLAVVAVGSVPAVSWLRGSGLDLTDGVLTGPTCHAVGPHGLIENIVVAGDVARWPNVRFDWTPRRVEHWITAAEHGQAAAESLYAGSARARYFTPIPRFWTEQHHVRIQSVGRPGLGDTCAVTEGSVRAMSFVACYTRGDTLVGAVAVNASRELIDYADLVGQELPGSAPAVPIQIPPQMATFPEYAAPVPVGAVPAAALPGGWNGPR